MGCDARLYWGWETPQETHVILLPTKWNKDTEGAWRMDISVKIEYKYYDGHEANINKSDSQVKTSDCESESSMSVSSD